MCGKGNVNGDVHAVSVLAYIGISMCLDAWLKHLNQTPTINNPPNIYIHSVEYTHVLKESYYAVCVCVVANIISVAAVNIPPSLSTIAASKSATLEIISVVQLQMPKSKAKCTQNQWVCRLKTTAKYSNTFLFFN